MGGAPDDIAFGEIMPDTTLKHVPEKYEYAAPVPVLSADELPENVFYRRICFQQSALRH